MKKARSRVWKQLAKEAGMEPSHIQKIASGKVEMALNTNISLAKALGISYQDLAANFQQVTENDIQQFIENGELRKKHKGKSKLPLSAVRTKETKKK